MSEQLYNVVRFFSSGARRYILRDVTLEDAKLHCRLRDTSSAKAVSAKAKRRTRRCGPWFDGITLGRKKRSTN